jgi:hypothetical protein
MIFGVKRVEEAQLLNGNGTPPQLQGILNRSGLATTVVTAAGLTAMKAMVGIYNQITALRAVSFVEPDAIVIHPTDWQTIRLGVDGQQQFYGGGPFTGAYGNPAPSNLSNLWGLKARHHHRDRPGHRPGRRLRRVGAGLPQPGHQRADDRQQRGRLHQQPHHPAC